MALTTMYNAKIGSPATTLSAGIDASQTTVPLVSASVLPTAPNICTIGEGVEAEVVRYSGISGNDLIGVERGFQGAPKSHASGSVVGRFFTAYDHDTFKGNILQLETDIGNIDPEVDLTPIESQLGEHVDAELPHITTDPETNTTYKWGLAVVDGVWGYIYEEVV